MAKIKAIWQYRHCTQKISNKQLQYLTWYNTLTNFTFCLWCFTILLHNTHVLETKECPATNIFNFISYKTQKQNPFQLTWLFKCSLYKSLLENSTWQEKQTYSKASCWFISWFASRYLSLNVRSHFLQWKGRSPVCFNRCNLKWLLYLKTLRQIGHLCALSLVCMGMCAYKLDRLTVEKVQWGHLCLCVLESLSPVR